MKNNTLRVLMFSAAATVAAVAAEQDLVPVDAGVERAELEQALQVPDFLRAGLETAVRGAETAEEALAQTTQYVKSALSGMAPAQKKAAGSFLRQATAYFNMLAAIDEAAQQPEAEEEVVAAADPVFVARAQLEQQPEAAEPQRVVADEPAEAEVVAAAEPEVVAEPQLVVADEPEAAAEPQPVVGRGQRRR
ncbi:MAG TPA: hypothetical protein DIC42_04465 [Holosporales bacterium]|nr:hypothetical protein [Holosporales bacterium]